ncbi:hypothetical protein F7P10_23945 [Actinomadura sp. WMMB 499]|nr:hypothetical protein F7P10_23945 [Actinomadura sp. WMMB 499]
MSTVPPGRTSLNQIGKPSGSPRIWTLPPKPPVFPENQASIVSPCTLMVLARHRSAAKILPSISRCGSPSATALSRAWCRSGARSARTSTASWR